MRFGVCCSVADAHKVVAAGFDFVELPMASTVGDESFDLSILQGLPVEATNIFFPPWVRLLGPEATPYEEYAERAFERAGRIGVRRAVLGSGGARRRPEKMDPIAAELRFVQIASELSRIGARHHIVVAPESLNASETNVGNDLDILAEALLEAGVGYTADSYHALRETSPGHSTNWKTQLPHPPVHVHLADAERRPPSPDDPAISSFAARLAELGYHSRVSLECRWNDLEGELPSALEALRTLFGEPG